MGSAAEVVALVEEGRPVAGSDWQIATMKRFFQNLYWQPLFFARWRMHRMILTAAMGRVEAEISRSEEAHGAELCLVVETALPLSLVIAGVEARERAEQLFAYHGVWDTAENTGVLLYLLLSERRIEIVADRGISAKVPQADWEAICREMELNFAAGRFEQGLTEGVRAITKLIEPHVQRGQGDLNELPNKPLVHRN